MGFDWKEYLTLAQYIESNLATLPHVEAARRCAVSRAYYAAFCHARNYARDTLKFMPERIADDHTKLRDCLRMQGKSGLTKTAQRLDQLRRWRNACDYDDSVNELSKMLTNALSFALYVVSQL